MLAYGLNAKTTLLAAGEQPAAIANLAMARLQDAAALGLSEAYVALYEAHRSGWYGPVNPVEAVAYLIALQQLDPNAVDNQRLAETIATLRQGDKDRAVALVSDIVDRRLAKA